MKSKIINDDESRMTGIERIISNISKVINWSIEYHDCNYDIDPEDFESLLECRDLCDKILTYNYFDASESYIDYLGKANQLKKFKCFNKVLNKWYLLYKKDLEEKRKDLRRLFKLIVNISEDI